MDSTKKDTGLSFSLFRKQVNNDFFDLIRPFPSENKFVTAPTYLLNYVRRMISFSQNQWLKMITMDAIERTNDSAELIVISPAERTNIDNILNTFKLIPNYKKCLLIIPRITAVVQQSFFIHEFKQVQYVPKNPAKEIYTKEFHYDFFPVDEDYFLLPCYHSFYQINVENDYNDIYASARALTKIQTVFGEIPYIVTIGQNAINTKTLMEGLLKKSGSLSTQYPLIDSIFLFDRSCDMVTPLTSQMTFEGILDEYIGVNFGICETEADECKMFIFSEKTNIVSEVRGHLLNEVIQPLTDLNKEIKKVKDPENLKQIRSLQREEFKKYCFHLKELSGVEPILCQLLYLANTYLGQKMQAPLSRSLLNYEYVLLSEGQSITQVAESFIQLFNDWKTALRLIILQLIVNHKEVNTQVFNQSLIDEFGDKARKLISTFENLDLLKADQKPNQQWKTFRDLLCLTTPKDKNDNDELLNMCDKLIPLMVRILQFITSNDQQILSKLHDSGLPITITGQLPPPVPEKPRKILIFFIGGVTISEVNFIRKLGKKISNGKFQFVVGSTDQINMNNFMDQLCPGMFSH